MKINFFFRKSFENGNFSIERVFSDVADGIQDRFQVENVVVPFYTKGLFNRLLNICWAPFFQGDINHITGDIHYIAILLRKKCTIVTIPDCAILRRSKGLKKFIYFLFWYLIPFYRASFVTTISEFSKSEIISYLKCNPNKIRVIYCPVSRIFKSSIRQFRIKNPVILIVGTAENKNIKRCIQALVGINCELRIVGSMTKEQESFLNSSSIIYSTISNIDNLMMYKQYVECDLLLFASTYEGFGLPIIEAQSVGRPVVTSNFGSMEEVAGDSACLVDPYDINSIRAGILRVINDVEYRLKLVRLGLDNIKKYSIEIISNDYVSLYDEILDTKRF
jgi:glycosyltransferase involved in cell wall biosynthesis